MLLRILADRVLPDADTEIERGAVVVKDGRIAWVGPAADAPAADETIDLVEAVLLPGLVNAHSHLDLSHMRDRIPYEDSFAGWIEQVGVARGEPGMKEAAHEAVNAALRRGTTTFGDVVAPRAFDDLLAVYADTGVRARVYVEALGFEPERADEIFERVWQIAEMKVLPPTVETGISPHSPYSVSRPLLQRLVAMADGHARPLAVHVGETLEELAFLRHGMGPLRELLRSYGKDDPGHEPYGGVPEFLKELEVEDAPLCLIHCNYVRPRDIPAGAFVVYCPTAHAFFDHPEHCVLELLEEGVRVALGSDSAASGSSVDLLTETQHLARVRKDLDAKAVFRMATDWGARALGLNTGRLEADRPADLAAFTPALGHEILGAPDARCVLTVVDGKILHRAEEEAATG